ncbi:GNAT family N-acetyltransferase [Massilia sp. RP-1-19]|uniref:GNAT family N-acetyltransferase n=1 Tax=Massilia polaris TaxID=2728846 RepID=A0A848HJU9_9BURK|nr:GNAT family N-acetyltransferase [Massilia polaris]NML62126.1 GNAT family N-acetyltransferase [Massilia polaris]
MTISLYSLSPADLRALAAGAIPAALPGKLADGALPPAFVAARSLRQLDTGKSADWCGTFLIVRDADSSIVGACGFKDQPADGCVEIGYGVAASCRKRGIATAAVSELVRIAFASLDVVTVLAQINPDNAGSARVVQSLGFEAGGTVIDDDGEPLMQWIRRPSSTARYDPVPVGSFIKS